MDTLLERSELLASPAAEPAERVIGDVLRRATHLGREIQRAELRRIAADDPALRPGTNS